jgi:hypothetical protein
VRGVAIHAGQGDIERLKEPVIAHHAMPMCLEPQPPQQQAELRLPHPQPHVPHQLEQVLEPHVAVVQPVGLDQTLQTQKAKHRVRGEARNGLFPQLLLKYLRQ